jgi:hypothetical protein
MTTMAFPDDENGDVLRRMEASGDDLSRSRNIDFTVVFPNETAAERFARHFRELGYAASIDFSQTVENLPWDVVVVKHMIPSHEGIGRFENMLEDVAVPLDGRNDGWGCLSEGPVQET